MINRQLQIYSANRPVCLKILNPLFFKLFLDRNYKDGLRFWPLKKKERLKRVILMADHVHPDLDSTKIFSFTSCWFHKGQECNLDSTNLSGAKKKFYGSEFLGKDVIMPQQWVEMRE